jgi:hypothetical protein
MHYGFIWTYVDDRESVIISLIICPEWSASETLLIAQTFAAPL